jgi:hypothetical protein
MVKHVTEICGVGKWMKKWNYWKDDRAIESDLDSFDDDEFFSRYREERLAQKNDANLSRRGLAKSSKPKGIDGVLVTLLDSSNGRHEILQELHHLARHHSCVVSIVTIEATEAVKNWRSERAPALFAYRDGVKKQEWITTQNGRFPHRNQLEELLLQRGILD